MHTPGHAGGTAFRKSAVGKAFYDFYGENLFRTDLSVSLGPLRARGSLLDHSGKVRRVRETMQHGFLGLIRRSTFLMERPPRIRSWATAVSLMATWSWLTEIATSQ